MRPALFVLAAVSALSLAAPRAHAEGESSYGIWRNPKNSVHVEIKPCGKGICGYVVWASEAAKADARRGGTPNLIGLQLFHDFVASKNGDMRGKVFVPDLNHTFGGSAEFIDATTLRARGCLIGGLFCKTQIWRKVE